MRRAAAGLGVGEVLADVANHHIADGVRESAAAGLQFASQAPETKVEAASDFRRERRGNLADFHGDRPERLAVGAEGDHGAARVGRVGGGGPQTEIPQRGPLLGGRLVAGELAPIDADAFGEHRVRQSVLGLLQHLQVVPGDVVGEPQPQCRLELPVAEHLRIQQLVNRPFRHGTLPG